MPNNTEYLSWFPFNSNNYRDMIRQPSSYFTSMDLAALLGGSSFAVSSAYDSNRQIQIEELQESQNMPQAETAVPGGFPIGGSVGCRYCGETIRAEAFGIEYEGEWYCLNHAPSSVRPIKDYAYKPNLVFYGRPNQIHYGVELEVSTSRYNAKAVTQIIGERAYLKEDGSIEPQGFEIVSHPHTLEAHRELWPALFASPLALHMHASDNGLHVHVERDFLLSLQLQKMIVFVNKEENKDLVVKMAGRNSARWAKLSPKVMGSRLRFSSDRYEAINVTPEETVEFRIFRGTTNEKLFFSRLQFVDSVVQFAAVASVGDLNTKAYCSFMKGKRKIYPELTSVLQDMTFLPVSERQREETFPNVFTNRKS